MPNGTNQWTFPRVGNEILSKSNFTFNLPSQKATNGTNVYVMYQMLKWPFVKLIFVFHI